MDNRRSQLVDGRRDDDAVASFSGICTGGFVMVWPRRRNLAAPNESDALRRKGPRGT